MTLFTLLSAWTRLNMRPETDGKTAAVLTGLIILGFCIFLLYQSIKDKFNK